MPNVQPFKLLHYQPQRIGPLNPVLADTPGVIDPAIFPALTKRSEFQIARLLYPSAVGTTKQGGGELLQQWLQAAVLAHSASDIMCIYQQDFLSPSGHHRLATSVIAVMNLDKEVSSLTNQPAGRQEVVADFSLPVEFWPAHFLYQDGNNQIEEWSRAFRSQTPAASVVDDHGVLHIAWAIDDPFFHQTVRSVLQNTPLFLTNNDPLYINALQRKKQRSVLACFSNVAAPETHCLHGPNYLLRNIPQWSSTEALKKLAPHFHIRDYQAPIEQADFLEDLRFELPTEDSVGFYSADAKKYFLLHLKNPQLRAVLIPPEVHPALRSFAWTLLYEGVLKKLLGLPLTADPTPPDLDFDTANALSTVTHGQNQAVFLVNPILLLQLLITASKGPRVPQAVASIYPQIPAGFIMRSTD